MSASIDRKAYLKRLLDRSKALVQGENNARLAATFESALKAMDDPAVAKQQQDAMEHLMREARAERRAHVVGGPKQAELNGLRVTTVDNFMLGASNAMMFFTGVNLANDEEPWIENTTRQEIGITYIGQDGKARKVQARKADTGRKIDLHVLSTEEYEYQIRDIYRGDTKSPALANVDMAYDLGQKVDAILWDIIKSQVAAFPLTGAKTNRVYHPHSSVVAANLPTTNLLTPSGTTSSSRWRLECFKEVLKYTGKWGANAFRDGELRATTVVLPSSDLFGWLDDVAVDTRENPITRQIFESGYVVNFGGTSLVLLGDNTLDPAEGLAYVAFNKPLGEFFTKTAFDEVFVDDGIDNRKQNIETISMSKIIGSGVPTPRRVNVAAVRYRDAA